MADTIEISIADAVESYLRAVNAAALEGASMNSILDADGMVVARVTLQQTKASARLVADAMASLIAAMGPEPGAKAGIPARALACGKQRVGLFVPR